MAAVFIMAGRSGPPSSRGSTLQGSPSLSPPGSWHRRPDGRDGAVDAGPRPGKCNTEGAEATGAYEPGENGAWRGTGPHARANRREISFLRVARWPPRPPCYNLAEFRT